MLIVDGHHSGMFQSLKGFQRFCGAMQTHITTKSHQTVSIPKRVSEVLWLAVLRGDDKVMAQFQSLKGFQRFCGFVG